ncbi:Hypothetical protein PHPALM_14013 [Phytophthora palmivora]|uniref:Uncharacterized protein n=1 Tax=Phytophthora palmivora TaxID=4796 RepID=A0A2P4XVV5_9STRA|nr:Hypothetical protein PHPALM_14013 [Phytophthora palmivora]
MELLEWREVTSGVPSRMLSPLDLKRPQHLLPRPALIPSMSSLMSYGTSAQDSRSTAIPSEVSGTRSASPMPSSGYGSTLFGPTASGSEESNLSGPVESQSSGKMSSSSSLWSMGGAASAHMPYSFVAPPGMISTGT